MSIADYLGSLGVFMILLAYVLTLFKRLKTSDTIYLVLNLTGALLACLASVMIQYVPFIILEGVWALVSALALIRKFNID